ncbi:MAG: fumarylacetoacetate hydrolase family protein [Rhodospirillales bacterium]|nr:fumarylacetoacetate hydrolase family protein [Rhodospirillales bacterium]MDE0712458.1 fumarylacetoacetate hydrolase family protein [Rhodospirillales bacterium]
MKLVRFGPRGREKPGLIDDEGNLRSLEKRVPDISSKVLSDKGLERLARINPARLPKVTGRPRIGVPVADIGKIVCIGLNYIDHAKEVGAAIPEEPIVFMKPTSALNGPNDIVEMPKGSKKSDWEIELGVVIGTAANNVPKSRALQHVAGYTVVNDVSEREWQIERGMTWDKGKGCDTFCPVGPWMVTRDEIRNPQRLNLWMDVNGKRMQDGNTSTMIFDVRTLVSYISKFMTLYPGDLIATGTPPGVGSGMKPPLFLKQDDVMEPGIEGLGAQRQKVRKWVAR